MANQDIDHRDIAQGGCVPQAKVVLCMQVRAGRKEPIRDRFVPLDEISERIPPSPGGGLARRGRQCLPRAHLSAAFPGSECSA